MKKLKMLEKNQRLNLTERRWVKLPERYSTSEKGPILTPLPNSKLSTTKYVPMPIFEPIPIFAPKTRRNRT